MAVQVGCFFVRNIINCQNNGEVWMMGMLSLSNRQWYKNNKHRQGRAGKFGCHWFYLSRVGGISLLLMMAVFLTACYEISIDENSATISKNAPNPPLNEAMADGNSEPLPPATIGHNIQWQLPETVHTATLNQRDRVMAVDSTLFSSGKDQGFMVVELEFVSAVDEQLERKQQVFRFEGDTSPYEVNPVGDVSIDSNIDILTDEQGISYALWQDQDGFLWINDFTPATGWQVPQAVNKNNRVLVYQMALDADGQLMVLWTEQSSDNGTLLYARRFATEAGLSGVTRLAVTDSINEMSLPVRLSDGSLLLALGVSNAQGNQIHMAKITPEFAWQESLWTVDLGEYTLLEKVSDQAILLSYNEARSAINVYALTSLADAQTLLKLAFDVDNGWGDMAVVDFAEPTDKPDPISILQSTVNEAGDVVLVWHYATDDLQHYIQIMSHDNRQYWTALRPFSNTAKQMNGLAVSYEDGALLASWMENDRFGQQQLVFKQSHIMGGHNTTELVHGFTDDERVLQYPVLTSFGSQSPYLNWISMSTLNDGMQRLDWLVSQRQMTAPDMAPNPGTAPPTSGSVPPPGSLPMPTFPPPIPGSVPPLGSLPVPAFPSPIPPPPPPLISPVPMPPIDFPRPVAMPSYQTWLEPNVVFEQNIMNNQVAEVRGPQVVALDDGSLYVSATSLSDYDLFAGQFRNIENLLFVNSDVDQWQPIILDGDESLTETLQLAYSAASGDVYAYWKDDNAMLRRSSSTRAMADTLYITHYSAATGWQQVQTIVDVGGQYSVVVDELGVASVVWLGFTDRSLLNVQQYVPGEGLGDVMALTIDGEIGSLSQPALDNNGRLNIAWIEFDVPSFPMEPPPSPTPSLGQGMMGGGSGSGRMVVNTDQLAKQDAMLPPDDMMLSSRLMIAQFDGLAWSQAQTVFEYQNDDFHFNRMPGAIRGLAFDEHNQPVIISALLVSDMHFNQALFAIHFDTEGLPLAPVNIDYNLGGGLSKGNEIMSARIVYDHQGNVVVVWGEYNYSRGASDYALYANQYVPGEGWQIPSRLMGENRSSGAKRSVDVVMNQSGEVVVLMRSDYFNYEVLSTQHYQPDTGWNDSPEVVAVQARSDLSSVSLALDNTGRAVLAWREVIELGVSRTYQILTTTTRSE